jgi:hypothetical protein
VLKCDGFFSHEQLYKDVAKNLTWIVIVGLVLAVVFTIVLNSYWPILITMYNQLKKLVRQGKEGSKNQIQLIQFQGSQSSKEEERTLAEQVATQIEEKWKKVEEPKPRDKILVVWIIIYLHVSDGIGDSSDNNYILGVFVTHGTRAYMQSAQRDAIEALVEPGRCFAGFDSKSE